MTYNVSLLPGDGIGPEITAATRRVLEATGMRFSWDVQQVGADAMRTAGTTLPPEALASIRKHKVALMGPLTTPAGADPRSVDAALRQALGLDAWLRLCKRYAGTPGGNLKLDVVIVRENTVAGCARSEGELGDLGSRNLSSSSEESGRKTAGPDAGSSVETLSVQGAEASARFAFRYARESGRRKVTAVTRTNSPTYGDGLFLEVFRAVAGEFSEIEPEEMTLDTVCLQLTQGPERCDVLVLPDACGDALADRCTRLGGGPGMAPGAKFGEDTALFAPMHGSAPRYAGMNKANPLAMILSGLLLLRHLKEFAAADRMEQAIADVIAEGKTVTYDMKADRNDTTAVGTSQVADGIIAKLLSR